ncbi:MAG: ABC transporter substrate-binding protein [Deltaproteobacteria bacterium]|nr:ABC transporter substrate-binding protein [Deltaproteobacteria bacterium]
MNGTRLAGVMLIVILLWSGGQAQGETVTLKYGQIPSTIKSVSSLPLYVAERRGFFAREELKVEIRPIQGGAHNMVAALDRGEVDITRTATPYLILAALKGSDAVAITGETRTPIYSLVVQPDIKTYGDLKGKLLGLSLKVDTISISMRKLFARHGLRLGDYRVKELVGTPPRFECLKRGECAGVPLGQPEDFRALKEGYRRLGISTEAVPDFQFTVSATRRGWAEQNKDKVTRYVRAMASAYRYLRAPANREDAVNIIVATTGSSAEIARDILTLYFEPDKGVFPKEGELDLTGMARVLEFMAEAGEVKSPLPRPQRFVDLQFLRAAGNR